MLSKPLPNRYCAPAPQASATVGPTQADERSKPLASMNSLMPLVPLLLALLLCSACTTAALLTAIAAVVELVIAASEHGATAAVLLLLLLLSLCLQTNCAAAMSFVTAPRVASSTLMLKLRNMIAQRDMMASVMPFSCNQTYKIPLDATELNPYAKGVQDLRLLLFTC
jgi:hypothetical protein